MEDSHRREVVVGGDDAHHVLHRDPVHRMVMVVGNKEMELVMDKVGNTLLMVQGLEALHYQLEHHHLGHS